MENYLRLLHGHTINECTTVMCDFYRRRGHIADHCCTRQAEERRTLQCDYSLRWGHVADNCYTRVSEARQEMPLTGTPDGETSVPDHRLPAPDHHCRNKHSRPCSPSCPPLTQLPWAVLRPP